MTCQAQIFTFMGDPASYDPQPARVERVDTHAAVVFLAGDFAYKIKRAVRLPYLDFSTLEKRRAMCEREVEINLKTAPELYLGVVPITRDTCGKLEIDGKGDTVEWAVKMHRFDQAGLFDRLALKGELPLELMPPLAKTIAELHGKARRNRNVSGEKSIGHVVDDVLNALVKGAPPLARGEVENLSTAMRAELRNISALLDRRGREGFIRRCHGDLHLRNIVRVEGEPVLFDAIEFDEEIATVDILYDLAFLLMDLWHRGLKRHANSVFNVYLRQREAGPLLKSLEGLGALPLFLAVRAGVRAMVSLDRLNVVEGAERKAAQAEAREFFDLAQGFLDKPAPRLVAVSGLSGTGKSTLAALLAPKVGPVPGALVVRSDVERKRLAGARETEQLGLEHYTPAATGRVYRALFEKAKAALAAGHTVILDAVFAREDQRERPREIARDTGVPFTGLWLEAPEADLVERVQARKGDASDADASVVRKQLDYDTGEINWNKVDASGAPEAVRKRAAKLLGRS